MNDMDFYEGGRRVTQKSRLRRFIRRFLGLILAALVVLGIVFTVMLQDASFVDHLRRRIFYGESVSQNTYSFARDDTNRFGTVGKYLVVLSQNNIQFLMDDGSVLYTDQLPLDQPMLETRGDLALAYDIGGERLALYSKKGQLLKLQQEEGCGILSAHVNGSGYLAVTAEKNGYKAGVSVYNNEQELIFDFNSSTQFLLDAVVTEDNQSVLIVALSQENGAFCTRIIRYPLHKDTPDGEEILTGHLTADLAYLGGSYASLSDSAVLFLDKKGEQQAAYAFGTLFLSQYTLGGDGYATVLLNRYQAGSVGTLLTINDEGEILGSLQMTREVLDLSAAGEYVAVLTGNCLTLYNKNLEELGVLNDTGYAGSVLMCEDGSALVIGGNSAFRYAP